MYFLSFVGGGEVTEDDGMKYTKEYIAKVRLCSNLLDPPASEIIGELLDEIERLTAERDEWRKGAERFIQLANYNNKRAGEYFELHEQLVEKYKETK